MEQTNLCAFYARTSTEDQKEKHTIHSQIAALESAIAKDGCLIVEKYIDDGCSGAVLDRPALDRLRADAKRKLFQKLYVYSPDRLARQLMLQLVIAKELSVRNIDLIFLSQNFGDSPADRLLFQMLGAISEFERAQILERTRRGKLHKARAGFLIGSIPKFGYTYIKKTDSSPGRYLINPEEASTVHEVFRRFNSPSVQGLRTLAKELHRCGFKNRSGNTKWVKSSLSKIITDSTYIGTAYFNKYLACEPIKESAKPRRRSNASRRLRPRSEWIPIKVPAIIEPDEFEAAQRKLAGNRVLSSRNTEYHYLLKGLVFCRCGKRMYGYPCHGKPRYKCSDKYLRYPLPRICSEPTIDSGVLDRAVWNCFLRVLDRPEILVARVEESRLDARRAETERANIRQESQKELAMLKMQEERLLTAYREGVIPLGELKSQFNKLSAKKTGLAQEIGKLSAMKETATPPPSSEQIAEHFQSLKAQATDAPFSIRQQIIRLFADRVIVNGRTALVKAFLPVSAPSKESAYCGRSRRLQTSILLDLANPEKLLVEKS